MSIGSYPRVTVQGTGAANNIQNGLGLMVLNPSTNTYEAATAATFGGGGGSGGATEINQETQIIEAQNANNLAASQLIELTLANGYLQQINAASYAYGQPFSEYLNSILNANNDMKNSLSNIYNLLNTGNAKIQLVDSTGNTIGTTAGRLNVDTGA